MDALLSVPTNIVNLKSRRRRRSSRQRFANGQQLAVLRAVTAADLYTAGHFKSYRAAATGCGSNRAYVRAVITLRAAENSRLLDLALRGVVSLLKAAAEAEGVAKLVRAYRNASAADRVEFARVVGPTTLFDTALVPAL